MIRRGDVSVFLTVLAGVPALTFAANDPAAGDPIVINNIRVYQPDIVGNGEMTRPGAINLRFRNTRNIEATDVLFEMYGDGVHLDSIRSTGKFSPGVTINRTFSDQSGAVNQTVTVAQVSFADGSVWLSAAYIAPHSRPQAPDGNSH